MQATTNNVDQSGPAVGLPAVSRNTQRDATMIQLPGNRNRLLTTLQAFTKIKMMAAAQYVIRISVVRIVGVL